MFTKKDLMNRLENKYSRNSKYFKNIHYLLYQDTNKYVFKNHLMKEEKKDIFSNIKKKK